ncbi:hypothetical protein AB0C02_15045 [Micromonospora sp. NPDC048999]|uniref:hypothetical protein n=1 Tax=Micromonospora sp. NPDC048999 TaxID=3155391 RepID=UPI0033DA3915
MTGALFTLTFTVAAPFWAPTILFGPSGLAAYLAVRAGWPKPAAAPTTEPQRLG